MTMRGSNSTDIQPLTQAHVAKTQELYSSNYIQAIKMC